MSLSKLIEKEIRAALSEALSEVLSDESTSQPNDKKPNVSGHFIGKKVIIRTYSAGVFFGTLSEKDGNEVILTNARRLWAWKAAQSISLSAVAVHGVDAANSKIVEPVPAIWLEAIEIIPCSEESIKSIEGAAHVKAQ